MIAMLIDLAFERAAAYANWQMRCAMDHVSDGEARRGLVLILAAITGAIARMGDGPEAVWRHWDETTARYRRADPKLADELAGITDRVELVYGDRYVKTEWIEFSPPTG